MDFYQSFEIDCSKMFPTITQIVLILTMTILAAGDGFRDALSHQKNSKSLDLKNLKLEQADFGHQQSPKISEILQMQIGKIYHQYKSKVNTGFFNGDERSSIREQLKTVFAEVKSQTKTRLWNSYMTTNKNNDDAKTLRSRRFKLYRSYLRS